MFTSKYSVLIILMRDFVARHKIMKTIQLSAIQYCKWYWKSINFSYRFCSNVAQALQNEHFPENIIHFVVSIESQMHIIWWLWWLQRTYSVKNGARMRPTQSKWEIYLFIVTVRVKSTYPVMFVMIFDSILLVGILKRRTALKHSCLMNKRSMLAAVAKWWNLVHSVNLCFFLCSPFFLYLDIFNQAKLQWIYGRFCLFPSLVIGFSIIFSLFTFFLMSFAFHNPKFLSSLLNFLVISCSMHVQCDFVILFTTFQNHVCRCIGMNVTMCLCVGF